MFRPTVWIGFAHVYTARAITRGFLVFIVATCSPRARNAPFSGVLHTFHGGRFDVLMYTGEWYGRTTHWALTIDERANQLRTQLPDEVAVGSKRQSRRVMPCPPVVHNPRVGHGDVHKVLKERHVRAVVLPMERTERGQPIGLVDTAT